MLANLQSNYATAKDKLKMLFQVTRDFLQSPKADVHKAIFLIMEFLVEIVRDFPLLAVPNRLKLMLEQWSNDAKYNYELTQKKKDERAGETPRSLDPVELINDILKPFSVLSPKMIFHRIMMSEGYTADTFKAEITQILKEAKEIRESTKFSFSRRSHDINPLQLRIVVFIDELNTSNILGVVKEIFMDKMIDGKPIPDYIFFVGAINPGTLATNKFGGADEGHPNKVNEFVVKPLPPSMDLLVLNFDTLSEDQETMFLKTYLRDRMQDSQKSQNVRVHLKNDYFFFWD